MNLFAQIRKVDEAKRLVFGRIAEEVVDKSGEIMDYAKSKPYFVGWSEEIAKDTDGKSLGNVRAMHGKIAAGKLTQIDFNDAEKAVDVCSKVVDDGEWKKVLEGVYTGFSIGGSYVGDKTVEKVDGKDVTRYTAKPSEVSLVDRPCIPTARFFEVQKADGTLAKVDFKAPEPDDATVNGSAEEVAALGKLMNEQGLSISDVLAKLAPAEKPPEPAQQVEKLTAAELRKGMYSCSSFAGVIDQLQSLQRSAAYEAFAEGDQSGIAKKLAACIAMCGSTLKDMIDQELSEMAGGGADPMAMALSEKAGDLAKYEGEPIAALLKIGARNSAADTARLAKIHEMTVELGHDCAGAAKAQPAVDLTKADPTPELQKLVADAVAPLQKLLDDQAALAKTQADEIEKLKAQPAPARASLRALSKADDIGADADDKALAKAEPIVDDLGDKHEAAGLIKSLHKSGGAPLRK